MASVSGNKNPVTHLPLVALTPTVQIPTQAGNPSAPRVLPTPTPGPRTLSIAGVNMSIDLSQHTATNIVDIVNGKNITNVNASLDRYGQLVINGASAVGGDPILLQHLGFA
jgi:hypothetical protein